MQGSLVYLPYLKSAQTTADSPELVGVMIDTPPPGVASHPALAFTTSALAEIMTAAFKGYVVPQSVMAVTFNARSRREYLDLADRWRASNRHYLGRMSVKSGTVASCSRPSTRTSQPSDSITVSALETAKPCRLPPPGWNRCALSNAWPRRERSSDGCSLGCRGRASDLPLGSWRRRSWPPLLHRRVASFSRVRISPSSSLRRNLGVSSCEPLSSPGMSETEILAVR